MILQHVFQILYRLSVNFGRLLVYLGGFRQLRTQNTDFPRRINGNLDTILADIGNSYSDIITYFDCLTFFLRSTSISDLPSGKFRKGMTEPVVPVLQNHLNRFPRNGIHYNRALKVYRTFFRRITDNTYHIIR